MKYTILILILLLLLSVSFSYSQDKGKAVEFALFIGWENFDKDAGVKNHSTYGGRVAYNFNKNLGIEVDYSYAKSDTKPMLVDEVALTADVTNTSYGLNFLWDFKEVRENVVPYVGVGVGRQKIKLEMLGISESDTGLRWNIGGGMRTYIGDDWGLRFDIRAISYKVFEESYINKEFTISIFDLWR